MNRYVVSKFGGSSVGTIEAMKRSAELAIKENANMIVVSATQGTTNELVALIEECERSNGEKTQEIFSLIERRHQNLANEISLSEKGRNKLSEVLKELHSLALGMSLIGESTAKAKDMILSTGERLSSIIFTEVYNSLSKNECELLDARSYIKTDSHFGRARPILPEIESLCRNLSRQKIYVTQGYIGSDKSDHTTTLGRGGSDYSAALFARAMSATDLQIWTDVAGIATLDPRVCTEAKPIYEISYAEASELASFGAKVLHPRTLNPVIGRNIKVYIGNSFKEERGTWITDHINERPLIRGIAIKRDQTLLTLTNPNMLHSHGFLSKVFDVFDRHQISVDLVCTSEITVGLTLDRKEDLTSNLWNELSQMAKLEREDNLALVSLIGNELNTTSGVAAKMFTAIEEENIRLIQYGASKHHLCFLITEDRADFAANALHRRFLL